MIKRKRRPVLTEGGTCSEMERLRLALEVQTGKRTCFVCWDFNSNSGTVLVGDEWVDVHLFVSSLDQIGFMIDGESYYGLISWNLSGEGGVKILNRTSPAVRNTVAGEMTMRWVGTSFVDRHEEPLDLTVWERCAKARGTTLKELMESKPETVLE